MTIGPGRVGRILTLIWIVLLIAGTGLGSGAAGRWAYVPAKAFVSSPVVRPDVQQAARAAASVFLGYPLDDSNPVANIRTTTKWSYGTVGILAPAGAEGYPEGMVYLAHKVRGGWEAAVQYTPAFSALLERAPTNFPTPAILASLRGAPGTLAAGGNQLGLPWASGEAWTLYNGPHRGPNANATTPRAGLDFYGGSNQVRSARDGIAYLDCANRVRIDHGDGYQTAYYHLVGIAVGNGQPVARGQVLGMTGTGVGCGGRASRNHTHFSIYLNGFEIAIAGQQIGGWTVESGGVEYAGCLVHRGVRRCAQRGLILNDGTIGADTVVPTPAPLLRPTAAYCATPDEQRLIQLINEVRLQNGVYALPPSQTLGAAARFHALDMSRYDYRGEVLADGTTWDQNMVDHGYNFPWTRLLVGGAAYATPEQAIAAWQADPTRMAIMLGADPGAAIGVGAVHDPASPNQHSWVVYYGRYLDVPADSCATPTPTSTSTATSTATPSPSPTSTSTASAIPTLSATAAATISVTSTPKPTSTPRATRTPTKTPKPSATRTSTRTSTPIPTKTAVSTATGTAVPATATATMELAPACALSPNHGRASAFVSVTCSGYMPGETVKLAFDTSAKVRNTYVTDGAGGFTGAFDVPNATRGVHLMLAIGETSGMQSQTVFTVETHLSRSPSQGQVGSSVNLSVRGAVAGEQLTITLITPGGATVLASGSAGSDGLMVTSAIVPAAELGWQTIQVTGDHGSTATAEFKILAGP